MRCSSGSPYRGAAYCDDAKTTVWVQAEPADARPPARDRSAVANPGHIRRNRSSVRSTPECRAVRAEVTAAQRLRGYRRISSGHATPRKPGTLLDHLGVVVSGQRRLRATPPRASAAIRRNRSSRRRGPLELWVLVQEQSTSQASSPIQRSGGSSATRSANTMKLPIRTSSMRRSASNACRSCSPDSLSTCADSLAVSAGKPDAPAPHVHPGRG